MIFSTSLIFHLEAQTLSGTTNVVGKMSDVMWRGDLKGKILIDTLLHDNSFYGLGPCENLSGEILLWEGKLYVSTVNINGEVEVEEKTNVMAPFFAYADCENWNSVDLPDTLITLIQLESYLEKKSEMLAQPFLFKISAKVESASVHVVNLPPGSKVNSPDDAHKGRKSFDIKSEEIFALGFFSKYHKTIFTHHDTFLHIHLMSASKRIMGHLDECNFKKGSIKLLLPAE